MPKNRLTRECYWATGYRTRMGRLLAEEGAVEACYHCVTRVVERRFAFGSRKGQVAARDRLFVLKTFSEVEFPGPKRTLAPKIFHELFDQNILRRVKDFEPMNPAVIQPVRLNSGDVLPDPEAEGPSPLHKQNGNPAVFADDVKERDGLVVEPRIGPVGIETPLPTAGPQGVALMDGSIQGNHPLHVAGVLPLIAITLETRVTRGHAHQTGDVAAGRSAACEDQVGIQLVVAGMFSHPAHRRLSIPDGGRENRLRALAAFHNHRGKPFHRHRNGDCPVRIMMSTKPSAAVKKYKYRVARGFVVFGSAASDLTAAVFVRAARDCEPQGTGFLCRKPVDAGVFLGDRLPHEDGEAVGRGGGG